MVVRLPWAQDGQDTAAVDCQVQVLESACEVRPETATHRQSVLPYNAMRAACADATFTSVPNAGHYWSQVLDPANHAAHTQATTSGRREQAAENAPDPSWETIEGSSRARSIVADGPREPPDSGVTGVAGRLVGVSAESLGGRKAKLWNLHLA